MLLTVTRLSLSHAGLPSSISVSGGLGIPPAAGGKREWFSVPPPACWEFYGKRSFSVTTPCVSPTRVDTERLAERETLLHRLGSKLDRSFRILVETPLSVPEITRDFSATRFFCEQSHSHQKRTPKRKLTIFENTKQVIQDYDTVFDNSIPLRKNDLLRITYFRIPDVPGLHFVPWHRGSGVSVPLPRSPGRPQTSIT